MAQHEKTSLTELQHCLDVLGDGCPEREDAIRDALVWLDRVEDSWGIDRRTPRLEFVADLLATNASTQEPSKEIGQIS